MKKKTTLFIAAVLLLQSLAFSQVNPLLKYLPDDVSMVMYFDLKRMGSKIPGEVFRQSILYKEMMKKEGMPFANFLTQPEKAGIDVSAGIILTIKYQGKDRYDRQQPIIHLFVKLLNAETLTNNIKELMKDGGDQDMIKVYGTDRIVSSEGKMMAGWNNNVFVMTSGYGQEITEEIYKYHHFADTTVSNETAKKESLDISRLMEKFKRSQRDLCFQLLTPKNSSSLVANPHFSTIMNSKADIKMWNGGNSNLMTEKVFPFAGVINKLQAFAGNNKTALINFEDGKIVVNSQSFPTGPMADIFKKYPATGQNTELVRRLPQGTLLGLMNISYNQQIATELMQKSGLREILDTIKKELPFDISLVMDVFKSDIMLAVVKADITTTTDAITSKMNGLQVILAMPIADKAKFEKLKSAVMPFWDSLKTSKPEMFEKASPFAKYNDDLLVLSLSPETASAFLNNTTAGPMPELMQHYSKHPMVISINMKEILTKLGSNDRPERINKNASDKMLNTFGQIIAYGGEFENESINSTMEFTFSNKDDNALKQLFEMMSGMMEDKGEMNFEEREMGDENKGRRTDTTTITLVEIVQEEKKIIPPPPPPPAKPPKSVKMEKATTPAIKKN